MTIFIVFKITGIVSGDQEIINSLIGNSVVDNGKLKINTKHISFYKYRGDPLSCREQNNWG